MGECDQNVMSAGCRFFESKTVKIVQGDQIEWRRALQHRGGTFHYRHLLEERPAIFISASASRTATLPRHGTGTISINSVFRSKAR